MGNKIFFCKLTLEYGPLINNETRPKAKHFLFDLTNIRKNSQIEGYAKKTRLGFSALAPTILKKFSITVPYFLAHKCS